MTSRPAPRVVVIGGGVSGLASAHAILDTVPGAQVTVLERDAQAGGTARTDRSGGFVIDRGPNGFLANAPDTLALVRDLGLEADLRPATDAARQRLLVKRGRLHPVPTGPASFLATPLLSPLGKARAALEPLIPPARGDADTSVHAFAARRLGAEFAGAFVAPMLLGVTAGDARATSVAAQFPALKRLEDEHGGLLRGMIARRRAAPAAAPTGGRLTGFAGGGAQVLVDALRRALGDAVRTGAAATAVRPAGPGATWRVDVKGGPPVEADLVVVATPSHAAASLLAEVLPDARDDLASIPYAGVRVLGLGYAREDVPHPLDGFGFLAPRGEGVRILGCLFTSTLFPWQAPRGMAALRVIAGGALDPEFVELDDDAALAATRDDLRTTLGIVAEPEMAHHVRWRRAIPQYRVGHREVVARVMSAAERRPGLLLTGNAYHGVGLNDCVRDARRVAREAAERLARGGAADA